jgi:hypothetical protein
VACTPLPEVPSLALPAGISLTPPAPPSFDVDLTLCCKLLAFPIAAPPISLPPGTLNPAVIAAVTAILQQIQDFLDGAVLRCPRE